MRNAINPHAQLSLFPHMESLQEALTYIQAQLPISDPNELQSLLMMYHNTLLHCQAKNLVEQVKESA